MRREEWYDHKTTFFDNFVDLRKIGKFFIDTPKRE
jgi:hypothetical protein